MSVIINTNNLPTRDRRFHGESTILTGNAITNTIDTSQVFNGYWKQGSAANGDSFTTAFWVRAGTYTLSVLGETVSSAGKVDWYINNVSVVTGQDWYSASTTRNVIKTASITIASDGYQILKGVLNGKNASSSNFELLLTMIWIKQTSD